MTTSAKSAFGTLLQYGDGEVSEGFTTVAEVTNLAPPEMTAGMDDATSHDSEDGWDESIPISKSLGDTEFTYNWIPGDPSHQEVISSFAGTIRNWKISYPDFGTAGGVVSINTGLDVLTLASHGFHTGEPVRFSTAGALPTTDPQIDTVTTYFVGVEDADTFKLYTMNADAVAGANAIDFSTAGTGDQSVEAGTVASFAGIVQGFRSGAELKGKLTGTARLKPSGPINFT